MLKNRKLLGILLSIIMVLVFSISGYTAYYKYTQESGANFFVGTADKADALEDSNEVRQILDDLGNLLGHSKRDDSYPKDLTTGGTLSPTIIGGTITGITDLAIADGGTGASTASAARTNLELVYGVNVQAYDAALLNIAGLTYVSPSFLKMTAEDTYVVRTLAEVKADLDLEIGIDVQAYSADNAFRTDKLSAFAATTSAEFAGVMSDETGTGLVVLGTSPNITTPTGIVKGDVGLGNVENLKVKLDGTAAPGAGNDNTEGYAVGSRWIDITNDKEYVALDISTGAAVWTETTGAGGGASTFTGLTDTPANFTNSAGKLARVNSTPNALEFANYNNVTTKSGTCTLTVAEQGLILVSAGSDYTINLPTAVGNLGLTYHVIKTDNNYNAVTFDGDGTETINYENSTGTPNLTYARLNTLCAEATFVSDNSNWQVMNEAMGQVPECKVYLGTDQNDVTQGVTRVIELDTESYDIGSNFNVGTWVTGTATATTATHLIDTTNNPFTAAMVNKRVKNTTDTTYTYIKTYNSTSDVTLDADIFVNGEGYEIKYARFTAPISGKYFIQVYTTYTETEADTQLYAALLKNNASLVSISKTLSIVAFCSPIASTIESLSVNDYITSALYHNSSVSTIDIMSDINRTCMTIKLESKD